ncbi:MAG: FtsX-like permease family protein [Actinophytocola sp.]|uniref:ABC transporter permease n=1 Tax=Actinophytocola sp. TaxID=1872138 RepID=UPI003D6AADCB
MSDLALGVRLAVGGGRTSLARFALSTFGIAIGVAVLLVGASVGNMVSEYQVRQYANYVGEQQQPISGVDPVYLHQNPTEFRGEQVEVSYVYASGENHPVPTGMRELPEPGELVASPALADLLRSTEGELLRPRFPGEIVGELDQSVVPQPGDLLAFVGAPAKLADSPDAQAVYEFGGPVEPRQLPPQLFILILVGSVVLLLPVFIFVASTSRIAGAERDRRLSALRLVGSGARQVRRIAAAESLVSALAGLVVGGAAFLVMRGVAENLQLFEMRVYSADVVPDPVLALVVVLAVPALAVLTALFALRRTIIEPLGVVRRAKPVRRRLWWRLALVVLGVALMTSQLGADRGSTLWGFVVVVGTVLLLVGVPVLLPWLVERVAGRIEGGPTSWQLAIRRLQLDSGTSARVVGGVAVVLAGAIALQTVLMTVESDIGLPGSPEREPAVQVNVRPELAADVDAELAAVPAVRDSHTVRYLSGYEPGAGRDGERNQYLNVMDCAAVRELVGIRECRDGQVFAMEGQGPTARGGETLEFRAYPDSEDWDPDSDYEKVGTWTVPDELVRLPLPEEAQVWGSLVVTPGAFGGQPPAGDQAGVHVAIGDITPDELEQIRNSVAEYGPDVNVYSYDTAADLSENQQILVNIRNALYAGAIFTLLLAGVSLLVLALEHIRERRRQLAILAATGVQRGVLGRSLLWQVTLPIALGVAVALLTGIGLAWLIVRLTGADDVPMAIDWPGVALLSGGAGVLAVGVTALTLPFLRSATRLTSLRTE